MVGGREEGLAGGGKGFISSRRMGETYLGSRVQPSQANSVGEMVGLRLPLNQAAMGKEGGLCTVTAASRRKSDARKAASACDLSTDFSKMRRDEKKNGAGLGSYAGDDEGSSVRPEKKGAGDFSFTGVLWQDWTRRRKDTKGKVGGEGACWTTKEKKGEGKKEKGNEGEGKNLKKSTAGWGRRRVPTSTR